MISDSQVSDRKIFHSLSKRVSHVLHMLLYTEPFPSVYLILARNPNNTQHPQGGRADVAAAAVPSGDQAHPVPRQDHVVVRASAELGLDLAHLGQQPLVRGHDVIDAGARAKPQYEVPNRDSRDVIGDYFLVDKAS